MLVFEFLKRDLVWNLCREPMSEIICTFSKEVAAHPPLVDKAVLRKIFEKFSYENHISNFSILNSHAGEEGYCKRRRVEDLLVFICHNLTAFIFYNFKIIIAVRHNEIFIYRIQTLYSIIFELSLDSIRKFLNFPWSVKFISSLYQTNLQKTEKKKQKFY